ncbi:threonine synthase [Patescibacteria group bacterium]|nr:threonine synthase [Patescibacteria group bacterium]
MKSRNEFVSMGEGNTPLVRLRRLEQLLKWQGELWAKAEYMNPTGSFKDRGSVAEIKEARRLGKAGIVCASTGNMAASLSAYAARARLSCLVVVPETTPTGKLKQAIVCGATVIKVKGVYDACIDKASNIAQTKNYYLCGDYGVRRIGQQTIGIELAKSGVTFDAFICPVGNGTVGCAVSQGFAVSNQYPKFIGVQGKGADPIYQAWKTNSSIIQITEPTTIASAMNVGNPIDGDLTLTLIQKTNGMMLSVSDEEIVKAQRLLAKTEGIFVEKAAAATVAGLSLLRNMNQRIVLILTGNGLKETE